MNDIMNDIIDSWTVFFIITSEQTNENEKTHRNVPLGIRRCIGMQVPHMGSELFTVHFSNL